MNTNNNTNNSLSLPFIISLLPSIATAPIQSSLSSTSSTSIDSNNNNSSSSSSIKSVIAIDCSSSSSKKRQRSSSTCSSSSSPPLPSSGDVMKQLQNIHPKEYVKSAFTANGYDAVKQVEIITHCIKRFQTPTSEQLQAYSTDILMAVRNNDLSTAKTLYREGKFNCNACNRFGESILHIACRRGHLEMVQFFVEEVKMKVHEIRDDYHRTPLHDAFWTSKASPTVIDYLLRQPFVIELLLLEDKRGYTPLDYARSEDRSKWLHFFWERKQVLVPTDNTHSNNISNNNDNSNNNIRNNILLESEIGNDIDVDYYDSDDFTTSTTCSSNNSDDNNELIMTKSASEDVRTPSTKRQKLLIIG